MVKNIFKSKLKFFGLITILGAIIYFGISFYIANTLSTIESKELTAQRSIISENGEDVVFQSSDGLDLSGWFFPAESEKAVIFVHGLAEVRTNEFYDAVSIAKNLINNNYNVLMYDSRGSGLSDKARTAFGQDEGMDTIGAINYLNERGFESENIAVLGVSLGAISTLQRIDELEAGAVILETPASEVKTLITKELVETEDVSEFMVPGVYFMAKTFLDIDIDSIRPIDKVNESYKFLILHGEKDKFISVEHSKRLLEKSHPESKLVIFADSEHIDSFKDHPEIYMEEVLKYLEQELE